MVNVVKFWILLSTWLVSSGWILSAFHQLNRAGYGAVFILAAVAAVTWQRKTHWHPRKSPGELFNKFKRRFRRPAPCLFLVLVVLCLIAGALYIPENNDSNEYRIPRVWHWLAENQWHWIHTFDSRMNVAGNGFEWLMAPLMLFSRTDRLIYFIDLVSLLMLPGLVYSLFTRLSVRPRVAWWWMWLLSSGWCFVLPASSDTNDSFCAVYALAAVDFALRARERKSLSDLWFSILAVALMTGAKQTTLPLLFPCLFAIALCLPWLFQRRLPTTVCVCVIAVLVSVVPIFILTHYYTGRWLANSITVGSVTFVWAGYDVSPVWCFIGNIFCLSVQNLHPPVFPLASHWNAAMTHFLNTPFGNHFKSFEMFGYLGQGANEGNSGIGLWICLIAIISVCAALSYRETRRPSKDPALARLHWIPFVSLAIFMARSANEDSCRQMAAYYPFLLPALLVAPGHYLLVRRRWWQWSVLAAMLLTIGMVVVARNRPLFPAETIIVPLKEKYPNWKFLSKAWESFACRLSVEQQRNVFRYDIPAEEHVIGYATVRGSQEVGQWIPFERHRVERVLPTDTPAQLQARGIHYVIVDSSGLGYLNITIQDWTNQFNGTLVASMTMETNPGETGEDYLVRLNPITK